jgi:hypothetical protein
MQIHLDPGQSIQAALDTAPPGTVLTLAPGVYRERLTIATPGITLGGTGATIDGGDPSVLWEPAASVGSGVWQTTQLEGTPWAVHCGLHALWRINDDTMAGLEVYGTNGDGFYYLTRPASGSYTGNIGATVHSYWDGIEALWGHLAGTTYVRFRDGRDPNPLGLTSAPAGGVITVQADGVTLSGLTICGGETQVVLDGASMPRLEHCLMRGGRRRVRLDGGTAGALLVHCELYSTAMGYALQPPGEWERDIQDYSYVMKAHQYNENKFAIGRTTEEDTNVYVNQATDTVIDDCLLYSAMVGVACWGGSGTVLRNSVLYGYGAQAVWLHDGSTDVEIHDNLLYDAEHLCRVQSCEDPRARTYYFYHNQCWQPRPESQSPKHLNTSFEGVDGQQINSPVTLWVYHNSFAGGGWALDAGNAEHQLPLLYAVDNLFSVQGLASSGGNDAGIFAYNWCTRSGYPSAEEGNIFGQPRLWDDQTIPDFVVPEDSTAASGAIDLSIPFTIAGVTYPPLPGCTSPQTAFGARPEAEDTPAPTPTPEAETYLVVTRLHGLASGTYTVTVSLHDSTGQIVADNVSAAFTVTDGQPVVETVVVVPLH